MKTIIDLEAARELALYTENDGRIYRLYSVPTIDNLKKKMGKGTYDKEKAVKAWGYVADAAAKQYAKEFAHAEDWYRIYNAATRCEVARHLEEVYRVEYLEAE